MGITSSTQIINQQVFYDKINDLNDDCLAEIFMKLSLEERLIIESVCQRWKSISQISWYNVEKMNLQNLGLDKNYISQDDDTMLRYFFKSIHLFKRCGKFVKILDLTWVHDSSIMPIIKLHFPFIKKLKLQINDWIYRDFDNAFSNMKNLESLSIVIEPNNQSIPLTLIDALNGVVDKLKKLKFKNYLYCTKPCGSEEMTIPNQLASIIKQSKSLYCLSLIGYELSDAIIAEISNKKSLTNLVIHKRLKCNNDKSIYPISRMKNLEILSISGANDTFIINLSINSKNLKHLHLDNCCINNDGINAIIKFEKLKTIKMKIVNEYFNVDNFPIFKFDEHVEKLISFNDTTIFF